MNKKIILALRLAAISTIFNKTCRDSTNDICGRAGVAAQSAELLAGHRPMVGFPGQR
jgi:hypothetical protein